MSQAKALLKAAAAAQTAGRLNEAAHLCSEALELVEAEGTKRNIRFEAYVRSAMAATLRRQEAGCAPSRRDALASSAIEWLERAVALDPKETLGGVLPFKLLSPLYAENVNRYASKLTSSVSKVLSAMASENRSDDPQNSTKDQSYGAEMQLLLCLARLAEAARNTASSNCAPGIKISIREQLQRLLASGGLVGPARLMAVVTILQLSPSRALSLVPPQSSASGAASVSLLPDPSTSGPVDLYAGAASEEELAALFGELLVLSPPLLSERARAAHHAPADSELLEGSNADTKLQTAKRAGSPGSGSSTSRGARKAGGREEGKPKPKQAELEPQKVKISDSDKASKPKKTDKKKEPKPETAPDADVAPVAAPPLMPPLPWALNGSGDSQPLLPTSALFGELTRALVFFQLQHGSPHALPRLVAARALLLRHCSPRGAWPRAPKIAPLLSLAEQALTHLLSDRPLPTPLLTTPAPTPTPSVLMGSGGGDGPAITDDSPAASGTASASSVSSSQLPQLSAAEVGLVGALALLRSASCGLQDSRVDPARHTQSAFAAATRVLVPSPSSLRA